MVPTILVLKREMFLKWHIIEAIETVLKIVLLQRRLLLSGQRKNSIVKLLFSIRKYTKILIIILVHFNKYQLDKFHMLLYTNQLTTKRPDNFSAGLIK